MATTPTFATTPRLALGVTSAALDTVRAAAGSATGVVSVITGAASGTRINRLTITNVEAEGGGAPSNNVARFWIVVGANYYLFHEEVIASPTAATATAAGYSTVIAKFSGLVLPDATYSIAYGVATRASAIDDYAVLVEGADL